MNVVRLILPKTVHHIPNVSNNSFIDSLTSRLMIRVGLQFEILCHRNKNLLFPLTAAKRNTMSNEEFKIRCNKILGNLIRHYLEIYE